MTVTKPITFTHKQVAIDCFNAVWDLLNLPERTVEQETKMIHLAHSSFWHWTLVEDHTPKNLSVGYWQLSRVYATAGLGERSLYFAECCLEVSLEYKIEPFYIGYAYEAICRAYSKLDQIDLSKKNYELAMEYAKNVANEDAKEMLVKDLQSI